VLKRVSKGSRDATIPGIAPSDGATVTNQQDPMSIHPRHPTPAPALVLALATILTGFSATAPQRLCAQAVIANTQLPAAPQVGAPAVIATSVAAVRIDQPPVIDGIDSDAIWTNVPVQSGFREARPTEDADPKERTEFQVAYDPKYLYVFVRAYDSHPDSIIKLLSRRDDMTSSDQLLVLIDSYHDRRTGYEFIVNPVGVKTDAAISGDGNEDDAWNGIWDVVTHVDSLGWTAEYRIPFSQLRFARNGDVTFGFMVWRKLQRHTADITWPLYRPSKSGFSSQFGELTGLSGIARPERLELTPYTVAKNEPDPPQGGRDRQNNATIGGDLKYAVAPNVTLNATVNPDFGQIDADPSVLNLGAFETFFQERRPFFVEGSNVFDFRINCFVVVDCSTGEALFYSRRIGRRPSLGQYADANSPTATTIAGAGKLTGRFANGMGFGILDAVTERASNSLDQTLEPTTNYSVARVNKDYDGGKGSFGLMFTGVNRSLDQWSRNDLHSAAYSAGFDARRRRGLYEVSGSLMGSYVTGSAEAIAQTQRAPAHYFQRPDDGITYDSTKTSLGGNALELRFGKVGGQHLQFETGYAQRSTGFETNDIGFLNRAGQRTWTNWAAMAWRKPTKVYLTFRWNMNYWMYWTENGLTEERSYNTNIHTQFKNRWWLHLGGTVGLGQTQCARDCTRGGPSLKVDPAFSPWGSIQSDERKKVTEGIGFNYNRADGGRSHYFNTGPWVNVKLSSRFRTEVDLSYSRNHNDSQWFGNFADSVGATHYTFAELMQHELGLTWRLDYTFTPNSSLQVYASPFVSKGTYSRVRELNDPQANNYLDRYQAYGDTAVANNPGGFNFKAFNSNVVYRWEYRPGSTLFLVWSQGRGQFDPTEGNQNFHGDIRDLFHTRATDRFLVKVSYWFNR
jgi:hypothetical protein